MLATIVTVIALIALIALGIFIVTCFALAVIEDIKNAPLRREQNARVHRTVAHINAAARYRELYPNTSHEDSLNITRPLIYS